MVSSLQTDSRGYPIPAAYVPTADASTEKLTVGVASAASTATFTAGTLLRLYCATDCHIIAGTTATLNGMILPGGQVEYLVILNDSKIAGILAAGTDTLYITAL